jgi:hypothetical protein
LGGGSATCDVTVTGVNFLSGTVRFTLTG